MKRKILIVAVFVWIGCVVGGGIWGRFEKYLHKRSIPPGQSEVLILKDLYKANLFEEVLKKCDSADLDPRNADYTPEIHYIRWTTLRRLKRMSEAKDAQNAFLSQFPDHVLGADMHFSTAITLLSTADYSGAAAEVELLLERYPTARVKSKAADILSRLQNVRATTSPATTQHSHRQEGKSGRQ